MNAIRKAGLFLAAGLLVGCQNKKQEPVARKPEPPTIQASESLRQSLVRANPGARVGIVAATYESFAAVNDVPAGTVPENASVQILDASGDVIGYGLVRAVKDNAIHVLYQSDTRRGPQVGDLIMPASDAGLPAAEEMPAAAPIAPAGEPAVEEQATEPTRLPPRRGAAPVEAPADATPPADATARPAPPEEAAPVVTEPAPAVTEPAPPADAAKPETAEPEAPAAEPAPKEAPADAPKDAATDAPKDAAADAPKDAAADAPKDAGAADEKAADEKPADEGKAPESDKPDQNK